MPLPRIAAGPSTRRKPTDLKAASQSAAAKSAVARRGVGPDPGGPVSSAPVVPRVGAGGRVSGGGYTGPTPAELSYPGRGSPMAAGMPGGMPPGGAMPGVPGTGSFVAPNYNMGYDTPSPVGPSAVPGLPAMNSLALGEVAWNSPWNLIPAATGIPTGSAGYGLMRELPVDPMVLGQIMGGGMPMSAEQQAAFNASLYQGLNTPGRGLNPYQLINQVFDPNNGFLGAAIGGQMGLSPAQQADMAYSYLNNISTLFGPTADLFKLALQNNIDRYMQQTLTAPIGQIPSIGNFLAGRMFSG